MSYPDTFLLLSTTESAAFFVLSIICPFLSVGIQHSLLGLVFQYYDLVFEDMIQVTVKYDKQVVVLDRISKDVRCSALLSMLEVQLGVKIPGNARLMGNGHFLGIGESIEEVIHTSGNFYSSARI